MKHNPKKRILNDDGNEIVEDLIFQITKWKIEANSGHNDGWTRKYYQDKLDTFKSAMSEALDGS